MQVHSTEQFNAVFSIIQNKIVVQIIRRYPFLLSKVFSAVCLLWVLYVYMFLKTFFCYPERVKEFKPIAWGWNKKLFYRNPLLNIPMGNNVRTYYSVDVMKLCFNPILLIFSCSSFYATFDHILWNGYSACIAHVSSWVMWKIELRIRKFFSNSWSTYC